jgi:hypothetical protein
MTIAIKPTATTATIEHNDSTILTVDSSGNITPSNDLYPKVPAFSASLTSDQNFTNNVWTKIQFSTEDFDTNSDYDHSTNYRFTPTVAGYYFINCYVRINYSSTSADQIYVNLYKNGSSYVSSNRLNVTGNWGNIGISCLIYCNGSSDYIEAYGYANHQSPFFDQNAIQISRFTGHLVSV